jgi:hypothetical protein
VWFQKKGSNVAVTGEWRQGSQPVRGIRGSGAFEKFTFNFQGHGETQKLNSEWTFAGTQAEARAALAAAGYVQWRLGLALGRYEYRLPAGDTGSAHFLVGNETENAATHARETHGDAHFQEYYPGLRHVWYDVIKPKILPKR